MRVIQSIFLWIIGIAYFLVMFLIVFTAIFSAGPDRSYPLIRVLFKIQMHIMCLKLTVSGSDKFDAGKNYIIMGNHESLFDFFAIPVAIPMRIIAVEAAGHFKIPLLGLMIKRWGNIPIKRRNLPEAIESIKKAKKIINRGISIIIMPEGGRTINGELKEFKKGPFHLALAAKTDILPFAMKGLFQYKSKNSWLLNPGRAYFNFGDPIPYESYKNMSVEELRDFVREKISRLKDGESG